MVILLPLWCHYGAAAVTALVIVCRCNATFVSVVTVLPLSWFNYGGHCGATVVRLWRDCGHFGAAMVVLWYTLVTVVPLW